LPFYVNDETGPPVPSITENFASVWKAEREVDEEHEFLLNKGWIEGPLSLEEVNQSVISGRAAVPKKDTPEPRLVIDVSASVNAYLLDLELQLPTVDEAVRLIKEAGPNCYVGKLDLEKGYLQFPVCPQFTWMLGYQWRDQFWKYRRLPFGVNQAPFLFCKCTSAINRMLSQRGIVAVVYFDDFLIIGRSYNDCLEAMLATIELLSYLGVKVKDSKTIWPCRKIVFLGIEIDVDLHVTRLPLEKLVKIRNKLDSIRGFKFLHFKKFSSLVGLLSFAARVVANSRSFLRRMWDLEKGIPSARRCSHIFELTSEFWLDYNWWDQFLESWNGVSFWKFDTQEISFDFAVTTDASGLGFGGHSDSWFVYGFWSEDQLSNSSTWKELKAIQIVINYASRICTLVERATSSAFISNQMIKH